MDTRAILTDLAVIAILLTGISRFRTPTGARQGNGIAAFALACALGLVLYRYRIADLRLVFLFMLIGGAVGWALAVRVSMVQIPAMVAFQHGAGGVAACAVSFVELTRTGALLSASQEASALLGLVIGAATFSGSMIASAKLANRIRQTPVVWPRHNAILVALTGVILLLVTATVARTGGPGGVGTEVAALVLAAVILGVVFSIRIGGADMPVLISFLNATAGLAAAFCGVAIENRLLIACGATVAASGSILTHVMCRAMNRGLSTVFAGIGSPPAEPPPAPQTAPPTISEPASAGVGERSGPDAAAGAGVVRPAGGLPACADGLERAAGLLRDARRVIIIPGYGMALAEAQAEVVGLCEDLVARGKDVRFAIHPVAGRMPGHMHVLLAEAEVDYARLADLKDVNDDFPETDVALIVGACDVVNPAAIENENTPISGMPILRADQARHVIVCNLDERPGYSGVPNPLYGLPKTLTLWGDAQETVRRLREAVARA